MVKDTMKRAMPSSQRVWPRPDPGTAAFTAESGG